MLRLQTLASMSEVKIPFEALRDQINSAVDCIVQLSRMADGSRKITEIAMLASRDRDTFELATACRYDAKPMGADRVVEGEFSYFPLPRHIGDRLSLAGEAVPSAFGVADSHDHLAIRKTR